MTPNELLGDQPLLKKLGSGLSQADAIIQKCILEPQKGFIISRNFSLGNGVSPLPNLERIHANIATTGISVQDSEGERPILAYEEFHPYPFLQYQTKEFRVEEFKSFNEATDHYFSNLESQKINQKQAQAANASTQKLQAVKSAHTSQLEQFEKAQNQSLEYAMMIERNSSLVESVLQIIRGLVASGMDWVDIGNLVKQEKMNKNPVAGIIWGLKLDIGIITLGINRFADGVDDHDTEDCDDDDSGSDGESDGTKANNEIIRIDIDIHLSAYANARKYFGDKKVFAVKQLRTEEISTQLFKTTEKKIRKELTKSTKDIPTNLTKTRTPYWFEKFDWFISDENYLCVGGKDATQNELLVKNFLSKGDIYIHADVPGASCVIIKNPYTSTNKDLLDEAIKQGIFAKQPEKDECMISGPSLHQAATMSVCHSKAWESKIVTSAWWVYDFQVSKIANNGEVLGQGDFMIRGHKNFLPPIQLVYGYGVMFKVSCEDLKSHLGERRPWMRGSVFDLDYLALFCKDRDQILEASDEENEDQISKENDTLIQKENTIQRSTSEAIETIDFESDAEFPDTQIDAQHESQLEEESCTTNKSTDFKVGDKEAAAAVVVEKKGKTIETPFIQRGRKTRTKKLNRYKDQDEEEKALMLDLLGCDKGPQPKGKRAKNAAKNAAILQQKNEDFEKRKAAKIKAQYEKEGELLENKSSILLPGVDGRVKKHVFDWTTLDYLTGNPLLSDNLQNAIIVGGPWQSLQKFKYKVKLIPGSTKRGKAATSAIQVFLAQATKSGNEREKELMKHVLDNELISNMLGKVKLI